MSYAPLGRNEISSPSSNSTVRYASYGRAWTTFGNIQTPPKATLITEKGGNFRRGTPV
jgi:hypothetical protein